MSEKTITKEIEMKILTQKKEGYVFTHRDFASLGSDEAIRQSMVRLAKRNVVRRISRGLYDRPVYSSFLKENKAPNYYEVAQAIARANNWTIAPSGNTALNLLHLSTQVSAHYVFVSDGPYKKYDIGGCSIEFKSRTNRELTGMHAKTALVVQALKTLGKENTDVRSIEILKSNLSTSDKKKIIKECTNVSAWIYGILKKICEEG